MPQASCASRPVGGRIRIRLRSGSLVRSMLILVEFPGPTVEYGDAGEHAMKIGQRWSDDNALGAQIIFPDGSFMQAAPFLDHRDGLTDGAFEFEIAEQDHAIGQVAEINR